MVRTRFFIELRSKRRDVWVVLNTPHKKRKAFKLLKDLQCKDPTADIRLNACLIVI